MEVAGYQFEPRAFSTLFLHIDFVPGHPPSSNFVNPLEQIPVVETSILVIGALLRLKITKFTTPADAVDLLILALTLKVNTGTRIKDTT